MESFYFFWGRIARYDGSKETRNLSSKNSQITWKVIFRSCLKYKLLSDSMEMTPDGKMDYRVQVVEFRKGEIKHTARIVTYVDIKKGKTAETDFLVNQ